MYYNDYVHTQNNNSLNKMRCMSMSWMTN